MYRNLDNIKRKIKLSSKKEATLERFNKVEKMKILFKGAGFPVAVSSQMDAWLKTHVAEVSPMPHAMR